MMPHQRQRYFDRSGRELSRAEALENDSVLKDGVSLRVHMSARDSASRFGDARSFWDANRDSPLVVHPSRVGGASGSRPGFRVFDGDVGRADREAAYREHEEFLRDAWKSKPSRDPEENEDDDDDDMPQGELEQMTSVASDRRVLDVAAMSAAHARAMDSLYRKISEDVSQQWRKGK
jgi:hypothetical protein